MKKIINYFLQGLLYVVPLFVTYKAVSFIFSGVDGILREKLGDIPGLGLAVIFLLVTIVGYLGKSIIASPVKSFFSRIINKAPLLKTIYSSVNDLMRLFVGNKKGYTKAVFIKLYENSTIERIGFITNEDLKKLNINSERVLVYVPHSYNFSGNLFVVEKKYITPINEGSYAEIMKLIVSGGVSAEISENKNSLKNKMK